MSNEAEELTKAIAKMEKANKKWPDPTRRAKIAKFKTRLENLN